MQNEIFTTMPVHKAYFKAALPVVMGMVVSLVYNLVDTWFIAQTQNTSLVAGVSLCAPIFSLMIAFGDIFGLGASTAISRFLGQKEYDKTSKMSSFAIYASIGTGIVTALVLVLLRYPILHLLGAREDTIQYAMSYYIWIAIGAPAIILNIVPNNLLRTEGFAGTAMICTIIGSVCNIILDPIFIFTLHMGAAGAAVATVISNAISDILFLYVIHHRANYLSLDIHQAKAQKQLVKEMLVIGIPASITNTMQSLAVLLTNRFLLPYGTSQIAGYGIAAKVNMVSVLIMVGFAFGAQPLLGYSYGAKDKTRLNEVIRFDIMVECITAFIFLIVSMIFAPQLIRLFIQQADVVTAGKNILRCMMATTPAIGIVLVCTTLFQAEGRAMPAFVLSISRQGIFLILFLLVLSAIFGYWGVLLAQAAADIATLLIGLAFLKKTTA